MVYDKTNQHKQKIILDCISCEHYRLLYICLCLCPCPCLHVGIHVAVLDCVHVHISLHVHIHIRVCAVSVSVPMSVSVFLRGPPIAQILVVRHPLAHQPEKKVKGICF